jgi:hypothetical protein
MYDIWLYAWFSSSMAGILQEAQAQQIPAWELMRLHFVPIGDAYNWHSFSVA